MAQANYKELLAAGCHFGHLTRKWNPAIAPYVFMEKNGIHIIDLNKTAAKLDDASAALKQIAKSGKKILFVATKKQAKAVVEELVGPLDMPYVTERWSGGMLTNFSTIRKAVRKLGSLQKMEKDGTYENISKRERLFKTRQKEKLQKNIGSISDLNRLPAALFIIDIHKEHIAVKEAHKLNIPTFGIVDTNSDPNLVDFAIPANDDSSKSVRAILSVVCANIQEGLDERKVSKEAAKAAKKDSPETEEASAN
jgi:small subunit ribosomal protein S2